MTPRLRLLALLLCVLTAGFSAIAQSGAAPAKDNAPASPPDIDRGALTDYLRYVNLWPAEVNVELADPKPSALLPGFFDLDVTVSAGKIRLTQKYLLAPDGQHLVRAQSGDRLGKTVFDTSAYPFAQEQERLDLDGRPSFGPADAPVTITVFSDFQCGFCAKEAKILRKSISAEYAEKVRLVFHDFPLAQIHDWANRAAAAGRCIAAQSDEKFWAYHDWVFEEQPAVTAANFSEKLGEWAGRNNLDLLQLNRCIDLPETKQAVQNSFQAALDLGLNSTPTLFINGRQLGGQLEWSALKQIIDAELDYQAKLAKKKEACCTVTLPGVFNQ